MRKFCNEKGREKVLFVGALGCDDVAGRVGHVAEKRVEEVIYQEGLQQVLAWKICAERYLLHSI
jgi:hypothetical protein